MKTKYTKKQIQEAIRYWEGVLRRMDEDRGIGRNILKAFGQRDKDDDFEDAVNAANEKDKSAVLSYINDTIQQTIQDQGGKKHLEYNAWTDAAETLINNFQKWGQKKPRRYKAFFDIANAEIDRRRNVYQTYKKQLNSIELPKGIEGMNWNAQHIALSKIVEAAVICMKSEVCRWYKNNELLDYIVETALKTGMKAAEKGVQRAEDPFKDNETFMQYCKKSNIYSKLKNQKTYNRLREEFIYYLEHQRPIAKPKEERRGGEWNYDPAYASPENGNSPWRLG